jgi:SAM-dependent methyltransferase
MPTKVLNHDPLFGTQKSTVLDIWDEMQRIQVNFAFAQELSFYYTTDRWHQARTVLDIGTGNGYYLGLLSGRFPNKAYHGIDTSGELVAIAENEVGSHNLNFLHGNLFDVNETYDFVIARLLIQHLDDVQAALSHIASITNLGGTAVIIDSYDPYRFFYPALPEFMQFFATYTEHEKAAGRDRNVADTVAKAIANIQSWKSAEPIKLLIPSTIPGNLDLFTRTYTLLVDLVEQVGELDYDYSAVKEHWNLVSLTMQRNFC